MGRCSTWYGKPSLSLAFLPSLPPSFPPYLPPSLPPYFPHSLPPSLPIYLPPAFLPPFFPTYTYLLPPLPFFPLSFCSHNKFLFCSVSLLFEFLMPPCAPFRRVSPGGCLHWGPAMPLTGSQSITWTLQGAWLTSVTSHTREVVCVYDNMRECGMGVWKYARMQV